LNHFIGASGLTVPMVRDIMLSAYIH